MKRLVLVLGIVLTLALSLACPIKAGQFDVHTDKKWTLKIWCRHDAIYWGSVIGEANQVRMVLGWYESEHMTGWHVQPQVKVGPTWHYFKCEERWDSKERMYVLDLIFISMPKQKGDKWRMAYTLTWAQFCLMHNTWMYYDQTNMFGDASKWHKDMNNMIDTLKKLEEQYRDEDSSSR